MIAGIASEPGAEMDAADFLPSAETVAAIEKDIATYNQRRDYEHAELKRRKPAAIVAYVAATGVVLYLAYLATSSTINWLHGALLGGAAALWPVVDRRLGHAAKWTQQNFRDHILPVMLGFIPDLRYNHGIRPRSFDRLPKAMLPGHNHVEFDDTIAGTLEGGRFELFELKLEQRSKNSKIVTFQGAVLHCRMKNAFPGTLVATRRIGDWQRFFRDLFGRRDFSEIVSGSERLDRLYEFRTDRRTEARRLLAGALNRVLEAIWKQWPNDTAQLGIAGTDVFVMLPSGRNFFELPEIGTPVTYRSDIEPMVRQIARFLAIAGELRAIDEGLKPPETDA